MAGSSITITQQVAKDDMKALWAVGATVNVNFDATHSAAIKDPHFDRCHYQFSPVATARQKSFGNLQQIKIWNSRGSEIWWKPDQIGSDELEQQYDPFGEDAGGRARYQPLQSGQEWWLYQQRTYPKRLTLEISK